MVLGTSCVCKAAPRCQRSRKARAHADKLSWWLYRVLTWNSQSTFCVAAGQAWPCTAQLRPPSLYPKTCTAHPERMAGLTRGNKETTSCRSGAWPRGGAVEQRKDWRRREVNHPRGPGEPVAAWSQLCLHRSCWFLCPFTYVR